MSFEAEQRAIDYEKAYPVYATAITNWAACYSKENPSDTLGFDVMQKYPKQCMALLAATARIIGGAYGTVVPPLINKLPLDAAKVAQVALIKLKLAARFRPREADLNLVKRLDRDCQQMELMLMAMPGLWPRKSLLSPDPAIISASGWSAFPQLPVIYHAGLIDTDKCPLIFYGDDACEIDRESSSSRAFEELVASIIVV